MDLCIGYCAGGDGACAGGALGWCREESRQSVPLRAVVHVLPVVYALQSNKLDSDYGRAQRNLFEQDASALREATWIWKITNRNDDVMPMKDPVHPGALAKANLDELNLSVAEAAKPMKITRQQLHNVMQGRSGVSPEMALRFEKAFGGSADMWLRMQGAYDLAQARKRQGKMNIPRLVEHQSL